MTNKPKSIKDKLSIKMYGDRDVATAVYRLLEDHGYKIYGKINNGNPYVTQKGEKGFASSVTIFVPFEEQEDESEE